MSESAAKLPRHPKRSRNRCHGSEPGRARSGKGTGWRWIVTESSSSSGWNPWPYDFAMSGFQLMISGEIFRGRYREDYEVARAITPDTPLEYTIPLPQLNHTIPAGHRLMVQVQSTWFPLYDRNPQTFVPDIMSAPPAAYKKQTHRVHHDRRHPTYLEFRVDPQ